MKNIQMQFHSASMEYEKKSSSKSINNLDVQLRFVRAYTCEIVCE